MILDNDQLYQLTKRKRSNAQAAVLNSMGIQHKRRPDGSVVVSEAHVEHLLGGAMVKEQDRLTEPNWEAAR